MFDGSKKQSLKGEGDAGDDVGKPTTGRFIFKGLSVRELVQYHDEIRSLLPPLTLKEMDLEGELLMQFHAIRSMQNLVLDDDSVPVNQRAQVANTVGTTLNRMAELQTTVYTSERFKRIENLLIRALRELPEASQKAFLDSYERLLAEVK